MINDDWGLAEQNAYERMQDDEERIPVEKFLEWVNELKHNGNI